MKGSIFFLVLFCISSTGIFAQPSNVSEDERAIREVIEMESKYFWARDYRNWKKCWVQEDYIVWTAATRDGVTQYVGWKEWSRVVTDLFSDSPEPQPYNVRKYDYQFHIYGDGAWVTFTQDTGSQSQESRILEKKDGKWRIASLQAIYIADDDGAETLGQNE